MKRAKMLGMLALALVFAMTALAEEPVRLDKARFLDKLKGGWAGQMAGACFGFPYEWAFGCEGFRFVARPILEDLQPWTPDRIKGALTQDDIYVEVVFLQSIQKHGLEVTSQQAGDDFGRTRFELWHANLAARENIRRGLVPPESGNPKHTVHADDLDFQIESDLFGLMCPGLPQESNRLCDLFGHIMCYGDGVYAGMFMAGMYTAAYFEDNDVGKVVQAGLACIPEKSLYHRTISDVVRWHKQNPDDWLATWKLVEGKYNDNMDCEPELRASIDAKLNGAYVVLGLLYGNGDFARTIELATRCGQDADCNPSSAAGVLGCMKGFSAIPAEWVSGLEAIRAQEFSNTDHTFDSLLEACRVTAEQVIQRAGGFVDAGAYLIPRQAPRPPLKLEQWEDQRIGVSSSHH